METAKLFMDASEDVSVGGCVGRCAGCRYRRSRAVVEKTLEKTLVEVWLLVEIGEALGRDRY
jgi:hypothetical protein